VGALWASQVFAVCGRLSGRENCGRHRFSRFVGVKVGVAGQSISIDENITFQLKFFVNRQVLMRTIHFR